MTQFRKDIERLINQYSAENASNTPDFILARFICECLEALNTATRERDHWYGRDEAHAPAPRR